MLRWSIAKAFNSKAAIAKALIIFIILRRMISSQAFLFCSPRIRIVSLDQMLKVGVGFTYCRLPRLP